MFLALTNRCRRKPDEEHTSFIINDFLMPDLLHPLTACLNPVIHFFFCSHLVFFFFTFLQLNSLFSCTSINTVDFHINFLYMSLITVLKQNHIVFKTFFHLFFFVIVLIYTCSKSSNSLIELNLYKNLYKNTCRI